MAAVETRIKLALELLDKLAEGRFGFELNPLEDDGPTSPPPPPPPPWRPLPRQDFEMTERPEQTPQNTESSPEMAPQTARRRAASGDID